ncbi:unnamed protein product [Lathyrus oleraceus]
MWMVADLIRPVVEAWLSCKAGVALFCQEQTEFGMHCIVAQLVKRFTSGGRFGLKFRSASHCRATVELLHNGLLQFDIGLLYSQFLHMLYVRKRIGRLFTALA